MSQPTPPVHPFRRFAAPALLVGFIVFLLMVVAAADSGLAKPLFSFVETVPGKDKTGHFVLMGTLAFLANRAARNRHFTWLGWRFLFGSTVVTIVVTAEECSQYFIPSRGFSLVDLAFDYLGILVVGRLSLLWGRRRPTVETPPAPATNAPGNAS